MVDFSLSRLKHQARNLRLKLFLDGKGEVIASDTESPRECKLGKWIYSVGLKKYQDLPQVQRLEQLHADVHAGIKRVIELKRAGNNGRAEQEYAQLEPASHELLLLLTEVEDKVGR